MSEEQLHIAKTVCRKRLIRVRGVPKFPIFFVNTAWALNSIFVFCSVELPNDPHELVVRQ